MIAIFAFAVLLGAGVGFWGCGTAERQDEGDTQTTSLLAPTKSRATPSAEAQVDVPLLVDASNAFSLDLFRAVSSTTDNLICSPFSLSVALSMTMPAANAETTAEMAKVLHVAPLGERLYPAFNALDQTLAQSEQMKSASSLWGDAFYSYRQSFVDILSENYGAALRLIDFSRPEAARSTINKWVAEATKDKISELLPPGALEPKDDGAVFLLASACYFNAAWLHPFDVEATMDDFFHIAEGGKVMVPMMNQQQVFPNAEGIDYQAVELPYEGNRFSMVLILPGDGGFEQFAAGLDGERLGTIIAGLKESQIRVKMPRFGFVSTPLVLEGLKKLGMNKLFTASDFPLDPLDPDRGARPAGPMYVRDVYHKAYVSVGEKGTEAGAASAVYAVAGGVGPKENTIILDRPFLYLIRDRDTGQIVFLGQVLDPSQEGE